MTTLSKPQQPVGPSYQDQTFLLWAAWVIVKQLRETLAAKKLKEQDSGVESISENTVKVRGAKFTKTKGITVDFSAFGAAEYWLPAFVRAGDILQRYVQGEKFYSEVRPALQTPTLFFFSFCLLPMIDHVLPEDWSNPTNEQQKSHREEPKFRIPLYLWTLFAVMSSVQTIGDISNMKNRLTLGDRIALIAGLGFFNGAIGITVSHELVHKASKFEKTLGYILLALVNYMHWGEEHLTGHHENVATPEDPATSKLNESVYAFLPRTIVGSWLSARNLEKERLRKEGKTEWTLSNRMLWNTILPMGMAAAIAKITKGGWRAVLAFYIQGVCAASMLEVVNYLEHYGLQRDKLPDGKYEPVNPTHSWNSPHRISNSLLVKLQRHSDHHTYSMRPYHLLRNFKESPQLPSGYPGMYILSLFPPAFFWIMNPLVKAHKENKERLMESPDEPFSKSKELIKAEKSAYNKMLVFNVSALLGGGYLLRKWTIHLLQSHTH